MSFVGRSLVGKKRRKGKYPHNSLTKNMKSANPKGMFGRNSEMKINRCCPLNSSIIFEFELGKS